MMAISMSVIFSVFGLCIVCISGLRKTTKAPSSEWVTIFGYGSLMDKEDAEETTPNLRNHRPGILYGYTRSYNLVSVYAIKKGYVTPETGMLEMAARPFSAYAEREGEDRNA